MFMVVTALMFYAHCVFFNEMHSEIPVSDTFYSFGVLASYPLFYIFLVSLTSTSQHLRRSWLLLLPAVFLSVTVGGDVRPDECRRDRRVYHPMPLL